MKSELKALQEKMLECIKQTKIGNLFITAAPVAVLLAACAAVFEMFDSSKTNLMTNVFVIIHYLYLFSLPILFAENKITYLFGIFGVNLLQFVVYIVRSGFYWNAVIHLLVYAFLLYVTYCLYKVRGTDDTGGGKFFETE